MTNVLDHGEVELIDHTGGDVAVLRSMLVSTGKDMDGQILGWYFGGDEREETEIWAKDAARNRGRINYLMKNKHGTPFEHNFFTFRVKAPIFVFREWHRHRIGVSYNEQSGRYMELGDQWYIPDVKTVRKRVGKPGQYTYETMDWHNASKFVRALNDQCATSYAAYKNWLAAGIAPEQARLFLHVNHYSSMYFTCNARSLMAFCELRNSPQAQWEIRQYAMALEDIFAEQMPVTYEAFMANGRVAP